MPRSLRSMFRGAVRALSRPRKCSIMAPLSFPLAFDSARPDLAVKGPLRRVPRPAYEGKGGKPGPGGSTEGTETPALSEAHGRITELIGRKHERGALPVKQPFFCFPVGPVGKDFSTCFFQPARFRYCRPVNHSSCIWGSAQIGVEIQHKAWAVPSGLSRQPGPILRVSMKW